MIHQLPAPQEVDGWLADLALLHRAGEHGGPVELFPRVSRPGTKSSAL